MPNDESRRGPFQEAATITMWFAVVLVGTGLALAVLLELAGVYLGR